MAAESDVDKMPTVVITGLPRIAKKRPIAKERSIFVNIFDHKSNKSFGLFI